MKLILFALLVLLSPSFPQEVNEPPIVASKAQVLTSGNNEVHEPAIVPSEAQLTYGNAQNGDASNSPADLKNADELINKIYEYAADMAKSKEDPEKRKLKRGILSNFYPKMQRDLLKKTAAAKKSQGPLLKYLTQPYRFCIFPYNPTNSMTYCDNTFKRVSTSRSSDCKHLMCINCCDHLLYVLKFSASSSVVSKTLGLDGDQGFNKIRTFITPDLTDQCRQACDKEYPVEQPLILPPPPKDPTLGKLPDNPAKSCIDIKINGLKAKDGVYFLKSGKKPVFKAYCDMTTEGGGWTLFLAYKHNHYEDFDLDSTKLPLDPQYGRSHMNLEEAGFDAFDVTELRFFCISDHGPKYMHFNSKNLDLLKLALNGDQTYTKASSYKSDKMNMEIPKDNKFFNLSRDRLPESTSIVNKNKKGGFWDTPFSSPEGGWTIKGNVKSGGRYECGDLLDSLSGAKYQTLHQVWFRGMPPSKEFLEARLLEKTTKIK